ncbi:MAG: cation diffusion facilitator family transporter [Methylophilaceae bacterium]
MSEHHVHQHDLPHRHGSQTHLRLFWPVVLTLGFAFVEAISGWMTHSLALLGDAGHMFSDSAALGLAWFAAWLAHKPATEKYTYGFARVEVLVALINGGVMLLIVAGIVFEAVQRLQDPHPVHGGQVIVVAFLGLLVNLIVAYCLHGAEKNINSRAAMLHVMGDLLGSVAAIVAGAVIYYTGWLPIDPILSVFICLLLLASTFNLLREAIHVLMEGTPHNIDTDEVEKAMSEMDGVASVHDIHVWTLASGVVALTAHVELQDLHGWMTVLPDMREMLDERFGINHVTLQPETVDWVESHEA